MRPPTDGEILDIRDSALQQHPLDRALTMLMFSGKPREELAQLPIGARDVMLFRLREAVFGSRLESYAECPRCSCPVEFTLKTGDLPLDSAPAPGQTFEGAGGVVYRLPNSLDLAAIAEFRDADVAKAEVLRRCVQARDPGANVLERISAEMAERDLVSAIEIRLDCPSCANRWDTLVDIASFLWTELNVYAKRLLSEVHAFARAYGWSESEVLRMSAGRRQSYLELIASE
jgi:hypothetical protein